MSAAAIQFFFTMRDQIKLYHWQTVSYARHKASDLFTIRDEMLADLNQLVYLFTLH